MTPVLRLSGTILGTDPPNASNIATCARSHESWRMSRHGSTNAIRENGSVATNNHTRVDAPVTGSVNAIALPDQSTSTA